LASPSAKKMHSGKGGLPRVPLFPECHGLLGTRGSLPRVYFFPECPIFGTRGSSRQSENFHSPVVLGFDRVQVLDGGLVRQVRCVVRQKPVGVRVARG
jgi:hypothetical protein